MATDSPNFAGQIPARNGRSLRAIAALIMREAQSTYGQSPGGFLWAVLEPAAGIVLMSIIFDLILRAPALGNNFPYFFATGILPFLLYTGVSTKLALSIRYSRPFLTYPALTLSDALIARFMLNLAAQLLVTAVVIGGIVLVYDLRPTLNWPAMFLAFAMVIALTASVGVANCLLGSAFPVWSQVWSVINRPMFILSGVLFLPENVPTQYRDLFMLNPLAHVISQFRKGFFLTYDASYVQPFYVFLFSLVLGVFSLLFLLRNSRRLLHR